MIRGVIFDMDGTLFDTERLYTIAWKQVGEEMGYSITTELLNQCRGKTAAIIRGIFEDTFGREFRYEEARQRKDEIFMEMLARDGVPKKKGLMDLLSYLEDHFDPGVFDPNLQLRYRAAERCSDRIKTIFCSIYLWRHAKSK